MVEVPRGGGGRQPGQDPLPGTVPPRTRRGAGGVGHVGNSNGDGFVKLQFSSLVLLICPHYSGSNFTCFFLL